MLKSKNLDVFDLLMNKKGFADFSTEVINLNKQIPQVYIHVCVDEICKNQILRIGKATNGIVKRWIKSSSGHGSTFLWSIGESQRYKSYSYRYPNYLVFFAELYNLHTKLYVLDCESKEEMNRIEKQLILDCNPIWEQFKLPIKQYLSKNETIKDSVVLYGGAQKIAFKNSINLPNIRTFKSDCNWES